LEERDRYQSPGVQKVLVRASGPSLPVSGRLEDPLLELFDANANAIGSNNSWKDSLQADIEATGIPPSNDLDGAILTGLGSAAYTAVVRRVNDGTGVPLGEVNALP
jgi:hypothetical protein